VERAVLEKWNLAEWWQRGVGRADDRGREGPRFTCRRGRRAGERGRCGNNFHSLSQNLRLERP